MNSFITLRSIVLLSIFCLLLNNDTFSQQSIGINYQGIARRADGNPLADQSISLKLTVRDGSKNGSSAFSEVHQVKTNPFGLFSVVIGSAAASSQIGTLANVNWKMGNKFLQVEIDPSGGNNFITMGTSQLQSVPYAIHAEQASPIGIASGDLTGTYPNPLVSKIQGKAISNLMPSSGQVLKWDGKEWTPSEDISGAGIQGEKGDKGDPGVNGVNGTNGAPGLKGDPGTNGTNGTDGAPGLKGDKGDPAINGTNGLNGAPGLKGDKGDPGVNGVNGTDGSPGINGTNGLNGAPGIKGDKGDPGTNGTNGTDGAPGINGVNGTDGVPGLNGDKGDPGLQGPSGILDLAAPGNVGNVLTSDGNNWISAAVLTNPSLSGFSNFTKSNYLFNTKTGVKLQASNLADNVDLVLSPKGTGAILAQEADGTAIGGNNRGLSAVDLQMFRGSNSQVASGNFAVIGGGANNTVSEHYSVVGGGNQNTARGHASFVGGGNQNIAFGYVSVVGGGNQNTASGYVSVLAGGIANTASGYSSVVAGGTGNTAYGGYSFVGGGAYNYAQSYGETVLGLFSTVGSGEPLNFNSLDRLFVIGNGTNNESRSNAITVLKNANTSIGGSLTLNENGSNTSFSLPTDRGTSGQVLTTNGAGLANWSNPALGGLNNFTESNYLFNSKTGVKLQTSNLADNVDLVLSPKGTGAILAQEADGTAIGGNNRGSNAVDLQMFRGSNSQVASSNFAVVGGGKENTASGYSSVVAGGARNTASDIYAVVGGGNSNTASESYSVVAGGNDNTASESYAVVGGGNDNTANKNYTVISGGSQNMASEYYAVVSGGNQNTASDYHAVVSGGNQNTASGNSSVVAGGSANSASGKYSFVGGGARNTAQSYGETVLGLFSTVGSGDPLNFNSLDRLFVIGNGTSDFVTNTTSRSNAITVLKNANTTIGGSLTLNGNGSNTSFSLPTDRGTSGQVLTTNGAGLASWANTSSSPQFNFVAGTIPFSDGSVNLQSNSAFSWDNVKGSLNIISKNNSSSANPSLRVYPNSNDSSAPTWMRMGDGDIGAEFGIAGDIDQFFQGTVQGDAIIKGFSNSNDKKIFIGATFNGKANMVLNPDGSTYINGILKAGGITYPTTFGTSGQVLTTNGAGLATWSNAGLNNFIESNYSYNGKSGVALKANKASEPNLDLVFSSKGSGAILASQPDGTGIGGNNRGRNAVDLQIGRALNTEVASGDYAFIGGGATNTSSAQYSFVGGGRLNKATATMSGVVAGFSNSATNDLSFVGGGESNNASGTYSSVSGGFNNIASGYSSVSGGYNNIASGDFSFTGGFDNTAQSFGETVLGLRATVEPGNAGEFIPTDRLFTIGNGITPASRSNAISILKNANTTIGGALTVNANGTNTSLTLPINRGDSGQVLTTDGAGLVTWANTSRFYSIGDFAHGGIVFWVDESRQHGLVCAKTDQSSRIRWDAGTSSYTMALGDGPLAGKMNTAIIIANTGRGDGNTYASRICNELQITEGGKTYGDWYLPSKEELNMIYINKSVIDNTATANGGIALNANGLYSSSTESHLFNTFNTIWGQWFSDGYKDDRISKAMGCDLRAIRSF